MNRGAIICIVGGIGAILFGSQVFLGGNSTSPEPNVTETEQAAEDPDETRSNAPIIVKDLEPAELKELEEKLVRDSAQKMLNIVKPFEPIIDEVLKAGKNESEDAEAVLDKAAELKAIIISFKAAAEEALANEITPVVRERVISLSNELAKKNDEFQNEIRKYDQRKAQKKRKAIEEFGFLDVTFDVKRPAFLRVLPADEREPSNIYSESDRACGLRSYGFVNLKSVSSAWYKFIDDDLYEMYVGYDYSTLGQLGGFDAIENRLIKRLGPPHLINPNSSIERIWDFPELGRRITLEWGSRVYITATHIPRSELVKQRETAYELREQRKAESRNAGF